MMDLPSIFREFCIKNEISMDIYNHPQKKYFYTECSSPEIEEDAVGREGKSVPCDLVRNFYQVTTEEAFQFSTSDLYQSGKLLPMDLSSGLAVSLLNLKPTDHVLDLCCAPGGKLILSSLLQSREIEKDFMKSPEEIGTITGVDLSSHRLATCRSLLKKYQVQCARLFCADGTNFSEPIKRFSRVNGNVKGTERKSLEALPFHETTAFRKRPTEFTDSQYDKVLVDAQCTHDGSIKHIRKHFENDWRGFDLSQFEEANLEQLYKLQLSLLENGFKLLKPGGILIYSTCSLSRGQNEEIMAKFMQKHAERACALPFKGSDELGQLRLCPPDFDSGFFICRVKKQSIVIKE